MKKIRNAVIAFVLAAASVTCYAEDAAYYFKNRAGTTILTAGVNLGSLEHAADITVSVYDQDQNLQFVQVITAGTDGKAEISFYNDGKSGSYTCYFATADGKVETVTLSDFYGNDYWQDFIKKVNDAVAAKNAGEIKTLFEENRDALGADTALYGQLTDQDAVFSVMLSDITGTLSSQDDFLKSFYRSVFVQFLNENKTADAVKTIYDINKTLSALNLKLPEAAEGGELLLKLSDPTKTALFKSIAEKGAKTPKELENAFYQGFLLDVIRCAQNYNEVSEVIGAYQKAGALTVQTAGKSNTVLSTVYKAMRGKGYQSFSAVESGFSEELKKAENTKTPAGGGGGGGGGSSSGYEITAPVQNTNNDQQNQNQNAQNQDAHTAPMYFSDIEDSKWALTAINYLYEKGIISGDGDGTFAPSRGVTRPEMAKMLVTLAEYAPSENGVPFYDVAADAWYRPYVAAAYENGVISGYEDGSFGVQEGITRQEAAALIYRMIRRAEKAEPAKNPTLFSDDGTIAEWAKEAVYTLSKLGIISGRTAEIFSPSEKLTRAEAAMLLYLARDYVK